jgi:hypothetical protein
MKIKAVNTEYIQKSRLFLYPLLDIKRGVSVTPIQTYMSWEDKYCFTDSKLICKYYIREDTDFLLFEKVKLLGNPLFHEFIPVDDEVGIYVFDLSKLEADFWRITTGKYSEISKKSKTKILSFFRSHTKHFVYIQSYLEPEKFHGMYKEILNCKMSALKAAHELCSKPDLEKETLKLGVKIMNSDNNPLNLQQ